MLSLLRTSTSRLSPKQVARPFSLRSKSTAAQLFYIYAPDQTDAGAYERRFALRPSHLAAVAPLIESGVLKLGGMTWDPNSSIEEKKPVGSLLIYRANDIAEVRSMIESDVYYTGGVWDPAKIVILPFAAATPLP